jgi:hypothetical protein
VEAPTRRKDITPVTHEPDFIDQEDEPEITLPEGYEETDFDDRRPRTDEATKVEEPTVVAEVKPVAVEPEPEAAKPVAEEPTAKVEESKAEEPADKKEEPTKEEPKKS